MPILVFWGNSIMVSIKDCASRGSLPRLSQDDGTLQKKDPSPGDADQKAGRESRIPVILAKAAVAAKMKMQIADGMGDSVREKSGSETAAGGAEDFGGVSTQRTGLNEEEMVRNLKEIVTDDRRWALFAMGALGLRLGTASCESFRDCLLKDIKEATWDGIDHLDAIFKDAGDSVPTDSLSAGLIERTKLWLTYAGFFENLFRAVRDKNLSSKIDLYTDERLIRYLDTIGQ